MNDQDRRIAELLELAAHEGITLPLSPKAIIEQEDMGNVVDLRTGAITLGEADKRYDWHLTEEGRRLAAESSWVNANRNPGLSRAQIEAALLTMLGADRMIWVDGLAGHDITDGHIDTLARFVDESTVVVDRPAVADARDPWVGVAARTKAQLQQATTRAGRPYEIVEIVQPANPRGTSHDFLATYMNYYLCNGAVIAPMFGDRRADAAARGLLGELFPSREIEPTKA